MSINSADTDELLALAAAGNDGAEHELLQRHRGQLRRMVALRIDTRLAARFDPSDVVQEALMDASRKLLKYLQHRPLPFYPWLRRLTLERLLELHRRHIVAHKRNPDFEAAPDAWLSEGSTWQLAGRLARSPDSIPPQRLIQEEEQRRVHEALEKLLPHDREILVLRYLEQLSTSETAAALGVSESAVKMRHLRALERIRTLLQTSP